MRSYNIAIRRAALDDLDAVAKYISELYRPDSGHRYRLRILNKVYDLTYVADALPYSRRKSIHLIHPKAKTLAIMNHRWTVVFHVEDDYVIVDRIIPSKMIID